ncbi:MAG: ATP-binding protein [Lachnospiraceae bacterium]|nr:ATP-binding protein [Lachnospiraceae bacterium]
MDNALQIEAKVSNLDQVLDFVNGYLETLGCPAKTVRKLDLAVEEIFVNIASYAYGEEAGLATLRIETIEDPLAVELVFLDRGNPYNPLEKEDPDLSLPAEERPIGGLGIFVVKNMVDDLAYEFKDGQNILKMRKVL